MAPVGQKNRSWDPSGFVACPSEVSLHIVINIFLINNSDLNKKRFMFNSEIFLS